MSKKLVIIGAGDFAEIAYDAFAHDSSYTPIKFVVSDNLYEQNIERAQDMPLELMSESEFLNSGSTEDLSFFVAVGYSGLNSHRELIYRKWCDFDKAIIPASYLSSAASVGRNVDIQKGTFIFEGNNIQFKSSIEEGVIMWSGNHIGHHSTIGRMSFVSSHVVVCGRVSIGQRCFLGVNSTVCDNLCINNDVIVGAGALVNKSVESNTVIRPLKSTYTKIKSDKRLIK